MTDMCRYSLAWRRPDLPCPGPKVLIERVVPMGSKCPPEIMALWRPGQGYAICFDFLSSKPVRRWSKEAKASVRRRNLRRRLERRFPLFAQMFAEAELAKRPAYFDGE
ncbi:theronine dehydrogenase [Ochrobactrum sp. 3-3]|uniref:theronine dehydrogenase n=1 Tax=Ochrobactrum sp. 3-3 TaxID=1830124 RepID=UPI001963F30F|nr:theronine dehydrogenase [Ochrobactrum sp. 3-3]